MEQILACQFFWYRLWKLGKLTYLWQISDGCTNGSCRRKNPLNQCSQVLLHQSSVA